MSVYRVERRLWLTADRTRVVEDGNPAARYLYATPGMDIPYAEAVRYGLTGARSHRKAIAGPPENKALAPTERKRSRRKPA